MDIVTEPRRTPIFNGPLLLLAALLAGLAASLCLSLLTSLVAYWGPHGGSYFLGGNSALPLSYELAPALVSAGWSMLALHSRGYRHAVLLGGATGLLGIGLVGAYWAIAILTGFDFGLAVVGSVLWAITAPVLALGLPLKGTTLPAPRKAPPVVAYCRRFDPSASNHVAYAWPGAMRSCFWWPNVAEAICPLPPCPTLNGWI